MNERKKRWSAGIGDDVERSVVVGLVLDGDAAALRVVEPGHPLLLHVSVQDVVGERHRAAHLVVLGVHRRREANRLIERRRHAGRRVGDRRVAAVVELRDLLDEAALAPAAVDLDPVGPRVRALRRDGAHAVIAGVEFGADVGVDGVGRQAAEAQRNRRKVGRRPDAERGLVLQVVLRRVLVGVVALRQLDVEDFARLARCARLQLALGVEAVVDAVAHVVVPPT